MFLRLNYCDLVMLTDLDSVYAKKLKTQMDVLYLLTIDSEFHSPAVPTLADRVSGHTAVRSLVLFSHRTD